MASSSSSSGPFIYSCIAHGTTVLVHAASNPSTAKSAAQIAETILSKIRPQSNSGKITYEHSNYHVHCTTHASELLTMPLNFILITTAGTPRQLPYNYLSEVESAFLARFTLSRVDQEIAGGLEGEFGLTLKNMMAKHGNTKDIAREVRGELDNVRGIMSENIERVMERGDRIELLVDKTNRLEFGAGEFRRRSRGLNRRMWWKNVKINVLLGFVVFFLIYLFIGFGCGLPGWSKCLSH